MSKTHFLASGFISLAILLFTAWPTLTAAQTFSPESQAGLTTIGNKAYGTPGSPQDIRILIAKIVQITLGLLGTILIVLIIVAGVQYMTAGGNQTKVESALKHLTNALIGLIIVLVSYAITVFIIQQLNLAIIGGNRPK
ncbi:hypothetical protein KBI31_01735 [Patescibacteria group bacterium]|nr:hypothetical protein [Patescibacteria group bacterium]